MRRHGTTIWLLVLLFFPTNIFAQAVKSHMQAAYMAYRALQSYMVSAELFQDPANRDRIMGLLKGISANFHGVDELPSQYRDLPGFEANIKMVGRILDDAIYRLKEGRSAYSFWRLRGLSANCATCHSTYNVGLEFHDSGLNLAGLSTAKRAEFLMATRQYPAAEKEIKQALAQGPQGDENMKLLRYLLVIGVRVKNDPSSEARTIKNALNTIELAAEDRREAESWVAGLEAWSKDQQRNLASVSQIEELIREGADLTQPLSSAGSTVKLLRASGALHELLSKRGVNGEDRGRALYLLGFCYSKLPFFFVEELPELYLQQCIEESPGSVSAKQAYQLYKDLVTLGFTGSSGTHIPADVTLRLQELYELSERIPRLEGRI